MSPPFENQATRDLNAELEDWQDEQPESWKPKPGDRIVGELVRYDRADAGYGPTWLAVLKVAATAQQGEHLAAVWLSHKVLFEEFKRQRPQIGERVGIRQLSDAEKGYKRYAVIVDRNGAGSPDWDKEAAQNDF